MSAYSPLRLRLDGAALAANWRWLDAASGAAACGAAVKANGYGLGAREVAARLAKAGCRDFFVATWAEAAEIEPVIGDASLAVLHGVTPEDMPAARASRARPVLNTQAQLSLWREVGRPCDVMVDTGMNRLGLVGTEAVGDLAIDTLHSHLACADEASDLNLRQRDTFANIRAAIPARRYSLANSAGICLGADYAFDLTRPGLALYGGIPRAEVEGHIASVAAIEARVIQRRRCEAGDTIGYNAIHRLDAPCEVAILHIGYADGYLRCFSGTGRALIEGRAAPVLGRVSMDLTAIDVSDVPQVGEGDWVALDFDLRSAAAQSGLSQYELLTTLGRRYQHMWQ